MNLCRFTILLTILITYLPFTAFADPQSDQAAFENYFTSRFPNVPLQDFANGVYAIDPEAREQWQEIESFPPYEIAIDEGKTLFETPFENGRSYASCFDNKGIGIANRYPYFNQQTGEVHTLALDINRCREKNGVKPLAYKKGEITYIMAYMAYTTRGKPIDIKIPNDERAIQAYNKGKQFYYARRGQLNMSCAHCHVDNAGNRIRAEILSPALGQVSHFPVYRAKWGAMGSLHRRFSGCNAQVRAKAFPAQSQEYRNLEYFLTYMSNGLTWNGPGVRR